MDKRPSGGVAQACDVDACRIGGSMTGSIQRDTLTHRATA
jgi:hypothetical protein